MYDYLSPVVAGEDGSVVAAGYTAGIWSGTNAGDEDFAAVKLDKDGNEVWRWQVGATRFRCECCHQGSRSTSNL